MTTIIPIDEVLHGRRAGVFFPKCMLSFDVIDLISINPTSQEILKSWDGDVVLKIYVFYIHSFTYIC